MNDLLSDLVTAERANMFADTGCGACLALAKIEDEATRSTLERALTGTIGIKKLSAILAGHGILVSARQIMKHRNEKRPQ
jgi:hypothetical protein